VISPSFGPREELQRVYVRSIRSVDQDAYARAGKPGSGPPQTRLFVSWSSLSGTWPTPRASIRAARFRALSAEVGTGFVSVAKGGREATKQELRAYSSGSLFTERAPTNHGHSDLASARITVDERNRNEIAQLRWRRARHVRPPGVVLHDPRVNSGAATAAIRAAVEPRRQLRRSTRRSGMNGCHRPEDSSVWQYHWARASRSELQRDDLLVICIGRGEFVMASLRGNSAVLHQRDAIGFLHGR